jgi:hypothetical protein
VALLDDRCGNCGRDPDVRLVELGGGEERRPPTGVPVRGPGSWRRWAPAAAGVALVWAVLTVTAGPGDDPAEQAERTTTTDAAETTTTARPAPTTTTTQVIVGAPLLREPSGLQMVALVGGAARVVDLDTGMVALVRSRVLGATRRGLLVRVGRNLMTWPAPYDGSAATTIATTPEGDIVVSDPSAQTWVVGDGTLVWLVQSTPAAAGTAPPLTGTLLDLDGRVLADVELPPGAWPIGGLDDAIVVAGTGGVYAIDLAGGVQRITTGDAVSVSGGRVFAYNCDERYRCGLEVFDDEGRLLERRTVVNPQMQASAFPSPDGRIAAVVYDDFGQAAHVAIDGEVVYQPSPNPVGGPPGLQGNVSWSPDGRWLAIPDGDGVHIVDTLGGTEPVVIEVGRGPVGYVMLFAPNG